MNHNFGEKKEEMGMSVWQSPKYISSKKKAIEMIESQKYGLDDSDFWILMNKTKSGKMAYTGLIISHNGCLKINDNLSNELKFNQKYCSNPIAIENGTYMTYRDERDGMFEVGEISNTNCKNEYPYAMLLKRTFDRVVLKKSKLAFYGVYSDSESEEFKEVPEEKVIKQYDPELDSGEPATDKQMTTIMRLDKKVIDNIVNHYGLEDISELTKDQASETIGRILAQRNAKV